MRQLPPLTAVRVFEAAARHQNFTAAAGELGMTQAAVSYQVKALEDRVGAPLFVRERGRARLTPLGEQLQPVLTRALDSIAQVFAATRAEDESLLTITTTFTFANTWLTWRLGSFQLDHPGLAVRLLTDYRLVDLRSGEADVGIRVGTGPWEDLDAVPLLTVDFTPMCTPSFLRETEVRLGRALRPDDLPDLPLISPHDVWWDIWFETAGVEGKSRARPPGLRLDSQADEGHAAMGGQGFVLLTPAFWRNDMRDGRLVQPFLQTATAGYRYFLVTPPERRNLPKIKRFREWLLGKVADQPSA